jgi:hypothetical protein
MLIEDFGGFDLEELYKEVRKVHFSGEISEWYRELFDQWMKQVDIPVSESIQHYNMTFLISTVFTLKVLLSIGDAVFE